MKKNFNSFLIIILVFGIGILSIMIDRITKEQLNLQKNEIEQKDKSVNDLSSQYDSLFTVLDSINKSHYHDTVGVLSKEVK